MERKIGEIFEYNGEWYQCLKSASCDECAFLNSNCIDNPSLKCSVDDRTDNCAAIFKKLEKWGGPYPNADKLYQLYRLPMNIEKLPPHTEGINLVRFDIVEIEIKQNKDDMEDLDKIKVRDYTKVEELNVMEEKKLNLKPFDIQKAREGKSVCTRDGRRVRILCFDRLCCDEISTIVACVLSKDGKDENVIIYNSDGFMADKQHPYADDLMMLLEKKEGWINVYTLNTCYSSKEEAEANIDQDYEDEYIRTVKVNWEE